MKRVNYIYKAKVVSVYDGDTIRVNIDQGFGINNFGNTGKGVQLRLNGINAPEVRGPQKEDGKHTRDFLSGLILDKEIIIQTIKDKKGKYGRYLADIYLDMEDGQIHVNEWLVELGLAERKEY
jgi:micrococcal nuclease